MLSIYIDGSTRNNGHHDSIGNYGIVIFDEENNLIDAFVSEDYFGTTNNRMELSAFLKTFQILEEKYKDKFSIIYSDSAYCVNILTDWIYSWCQNNWDNKRAKTLKNLDLIKSLYNYCNKNFFKNQIKIEKVKGHSALLGNELSDALATKDKIKFFNLILSNKIQIKI